MGWIKLIVVLALGWYGLKYMGITPQELLEELKTTWAQFTKDGKSLISGDVTRKTAEQFKANLPKAESPSESQSAGTEQELNRELAQHRREMMEKQLEALNKAKVEPQAFNLDSLKRTVMDNIKTSGGDQ